MTQPIEVGGIYTDINILERPLASRRRSIEEILADIQPSALDRLGIAQAKERVPALDAVVRHARLMVMGKPVRSANSDTGTPSVSRSAFSMNSNPTASAPTSCASRS